MIRVQTPPVVYFCVAAHRRRGRERASAGENAHPAEQRALVFAQQIETPIDERSQRLLPGKRLPPVRVPEESKAFVEFLQQAALDSAYPVLCRQFESKWNAVEPGDRYPRELIPGFGM